MPMTFHHNINNLPSHVRASAGGWGQSKLAPDHTSCVQLWWHWCTLTALRFWAPEKGGCEISGLFSAFTGDPAWCTVLPSQPGQQHSQLSRELSLALSSCSTKFPNYAEILLHSLNISICNVLKISMRVGEKVLLSHNSSQHAGGFVFFKFVFVFAYVCICICIHFQEKMGNRVLQSSQNSQEKQGSAFT